MMKVVKSIFAICVSLSLAGVCFSCSESNEDTPVPEISINVTPESFSFTSDETRATMTVEADADWSVSTDAAWIKLFPTGGLRGEKVEVTVTAGANNSMESREAVITVRSGQNTKKNIAVSQSAPASVVVEKNVISLGAQESSVTVPFKTNVDWTAVSDADWCEVSPASGAAGEVSLTVKCGANVSDAERMATVTVTGDGAKADIKVVQGTDVINTPEGYTLVWNDEFNMADGSRPDQSKWVYDIWPAGFVNNELQRYVAGEFGGVKTAEISGGVLRITAAKVGDEVVSARLNANGLWTYGYFEARLKLPKGKGTWPAFWMMPANGGDWPHCGEIDIMEEVGVNPDYTSSSIHCTAYNHTIGTQKTAERKTPGAEDEFHVYALEWTAEYIRTYVDGKLLFSFGNDGKGDENTWPFNKGFHPILNLAWGGSWGGMNGVDETALPAVYEIDYVRIFQKL